MNTLIFNFIHPSICPFAYIGRVPVLVKIHLSLIYIFVLFRKSIVSYESTRVSFRPK